MEEKRFSGSMRVHIKDNILGNSIVVNANVKGKTGDELLSIAEKKFAEYVGLMNKEIDEKILHSHAKYLMKVEGWGIRRIMNHFAKFDIDIEPYINPQKKLIK